jgi:hypothetical protein
MKHNAGEEFAYYLTHTFIPDLKEAGRTSQANDFGVAVKFIQGRKNVKGYTKDSFIEHLEKKIESTRILGYECTCEDYRTAKASIYWTRD